MKAGDIEGTWVVYGVLDSDGTLDDVFLHKGAAEMVRSRRGGGIVELVLLDPERVKAVVRTDKPCPECDGDGEVLGDTSVYWCAHCGGTGKSREVLGV